MGKRKWGALVLVAALLVFGVVAAAEKPVSWFMTKEQVDDLLRPETSGVPAGFIFDWNRLQGIAASDKNFQIGYIAGVFDAFSAVLSEQCKASNTAAALSIVGARINEKLVSLFVPAPEQTPEFDGEAGAVIAKLWAMRLNIPEGVEIGQLIDVVESYAKNHPEEWQDSAAVLVWRALARKTRADWK